MTSTAWIVLTAFWFHSSDANCPPGCLCTSDIVNCGSVGLEKFPIALPPTTSTLDISHNRLTWLAPGTFHGLSRLNVLRLSRNQISLLSPAAFHNTNTLHHLDLSSNRLQTVRKYHFQDLLGLEELLLYNNRITHVESDALMGLSNLKKLYLSLNKITDFPFFSFRKQSHPKLITVDLSSNHITRLPLDDIVLLPVTLQRGLFVHNNSLECDCSTYRIFWHWEKEGYEAVRDFKNAFSCRMSGDPPISIDFLHSPRFFDNCTIEKMISLISPKADMIVYEGDQIRLDCTGTLNNVVLSYTWVIPHQDNITYMIQNGTMQLNRDGSLEILSVQMRDSGIYRCLAVDMVKMINETREVNLTVHPQHFRIEPFSTGYTTLMSCAITLFFILIYLYLTPCRCGCCRAPPTSHTASEDRQSLAFIFGVSQTANMKTMDKSNLDKHLLFIDPLLEETNTRHTIECKAD